MNTKEQKIEAIRAKCIEANPEIKKLIFGCEISFNGKKGIIYCIRENHTISASTFSNVLPEELDKVGGIIGRPIRLADVLLANQIKNSVLDQNINKVLDLVLKHWNLRKDSLNEQSEETIDFIYPLLKSKT